MKNLTNQHWMRYAMMPAGFTQGLGIPSEGRTLGMNYRYTF